MAVMEHYNPHLHCIATSSGWDQQAQQWVHLEYVPYPMLRKGWQWYLLLLRRDIRDEGRSLGGWMRCYTRYRGGL